MDLTSVTDITIPEGNVNAIKIGNLTIWTKPTVNRYKILKNGTQVANVTINKLVKSIKNGNAQTDWGIGAQVIVPYTDPCNNTTYELPFVFGTFTVYGTGTLGLQATRAVPTVAKVYSGGGFTSGGAVNFWTYSSFRSWLNNVNPTNTSYGFQTKWSITKSFRDCVPTDFVNATIANTHAGATGNFFLLRVSDFYLSNSSVTISSKSYIPVLNSTSSAGWEYWQNKLGSKLKLNTTNTALKFYLVSSSTYVNVALPNPITGTGSATGSTSTTSIKQGSNSMCYITNAGNFYYTNFTGTRYCLPACILG